MTYDHNPLPAMLGLLTALTGGTLAAPPQAEAEEPRRIVVSYRDLDLNQPDGRMTLERRVSSAARTLCEDPTPIANPRRCFSLVLRQTRPQIESAVARRLAAIMVSAGVPTASASR